MAAADLLPTPLVADDLDRWLSEDGLEQGDITSLSITGDDEMVSWRCVAREPMTVAGLEPLARGLKPLVRAVGLRPCVRDGAMVEAGTTLAGFEGVRSGVLGLERTILNVLGRLCGVATCTRRYVDAIAGTAAVITDTRKTMPGLRHWDKYAVVCGGGTSHRMGLHDAALFKDNHFAGQTPGAMAESLRAAIAFARADRDLAFVEVEVDTLEQLDAVLGVDGVDIVLLDNMPPDALRDAAARRDAEAPGVQLEASGGITLGSVRAVAECGVDRIAVGALTRDATMLDIGLDA